MATKLTDTGVEFPGNGEDPVEQSKAIKNVEGNEADSTGKITLSTVSGKTLDERLTEIEELGSGGGAVYLEQNTFGTNNYMFKDSYWWGGESVYSYSSANATQQTAIENLERGNVLNLSSPNSSEYYHVSSVDSANKRITLIRGTFNDRSSQNLTIDDAENGTFNNVTFTHVSNVAPAVTTGSWLQIEAGSNYSGSTISTTNGIGFAPMNLSTLPSEATHILFRVTSETSGHLIIYNREHFLTRSSSSPILESEKVHQIDVESSGSQSSSDEFWVPNNSFLQFWLTGSGTAHLYPVAYAVMDLSKVNLDGASIPAVNALSDEIIDLQNQVNSNDTYISNLQADVSNLENDVSALQGGGGGGDVALYAPPQTLFLDRDLAKFENSFQGGSWYAYAKSGFTGRVEQYNTDYEEKVVVPEFQNFKINHSDKYKLVFYTSNGVAEVLISDLIDINPTEHPTNTNNWLETTLFIKYDDDTGRDDILTLFFQGNDLVLVQANWGGGSSQNRNFRVYRIDMHLNAFGGGVSTVNGQTGDVTVAAGVTSVNGKTGGVNISAGSNILIDSSSSSIRISSTGGGGQTVEPNWSTGWVNKSGSVSVANGATLSFTHNLGTTDVIYQIYAADNANGTGAVSIDYFVDGMNAYTDQWGSQITDISNNGFKLTLGYGYFTRINDHDSSPAPAVNFTNHYIKVVASSAATSTFDGNYNSLSNKPTIPSDVNDLSDADGLLSSGGGEFSNHVRFFSSNPSWTKPNGVNFILAIVQSGGNSTGSNSTITIPNTSFHKKITSIISFSSGVEYTEFSDIIGKSFTFQYLKEDLNLIQNWVFTETVSGVNNSGVTLTPSSGTGSKHGFVGFQSPLNSTWTGGHSLTYGRDGVWLGGGEGSIGSPGRHPGKGGTLNGLATLGGADPGQYGGAGGFAGGGAGYTSGSSYITDHNREGGSGFGAGGGGGQHHSGEYDVYFIIVPSTQSSWNIVVGAGGTAANHMSGGGSGGQGAVFLYY